jgi:hypothetical protein
MPQGHAIAEIFTDLHVNLNDNGGTSGFEVNRAHLGYTFTPESHFSGTIIVNPGKPDDLAPGSEPKRYAYFREASIGYTNNNFHLSFGITGTRLFSYQQKFWGKRYIANTYQSINGYGFVADVGIALDYKINEIFKLDATLMNGEGYTNVQLDNSLRAASGLIITPDDHLAFRIYGDITRVNGLWQPMFIGFAGYKSKKVTVGGELTYKSNLDLIRGHHAWGFSTTGSVGLSDQTEIFARFDYSTSVIPVNEIRQWNYLMDGDFLILGIQHTFNEYVRIALDYQGKYPYDSDTQKSGMLFVNALFKFGSY